MTKKILLSFLLSLKKFLNKNNILLTNNFLNVSYCMYLFRGQIQCLFVIHLIQSQTVINLRSEVNCGYILSNETRPVMLQIEGKVNGFMQKNCEC